MTEGVGGRPGSPALETFPSHLGPGPQMWQVTQLLHRKTGPAERPTDQLTSTILTKSWGLTLPKESQHAPALVSTTSRPRVKQVTEQASLFTLRCFLSYCIHTWGSAPVPVQPPLTLKSHRLSPDSHTNTHPLLAGVREPGALWSKGGSKGYFGGCWKTLHTRRARPSQSQTRPHGLEWPELPM